MCVGCDSWLRGIYLLRLVSRPGFCLYSTIFNSDPPYNHNRWLRDSAVGGLVPLHDIQLCHNERDLCHGVPDQVRRNGRTSIETSKD